MKNNIKKGVIVDINQKAITVKDLITEELTIIQYQEFGDITSDELVFLSPYNHPNIYIGAIIEYIQNTQGLKTESSKLLIGALAGETLYTPQIDESLDKVKSTVMVVIDRVLPVEEEKDGEMITLYEGFATGIPSFLNYRFRAGMTKVHPGDVFTATVFKKDKRGAKCYLQDKCN